MNLLTAIDSKSALELVEVGGVLLLLGVAAFLAARMGVSAVSLFLTVLSVANVAVGFEERNPLE